MTQNISPKGSGRPQARRLWQGVRCAVCLALAAALLPACTPRSPDALGASGHAAVSGISGGTAASDLPGTSGGTAAPDTSEPSGASAFGMSGAGAPLPGEEAAPDVPEAGLGSAGDGEDICGLPLAPGSTEFPEADRAAALTDGTVALYLDARTFALGTDEAVGYTIENTTGHSVGVVLAPRLERWTNGVWELIPSDIGFCGTPDSMEETHAGSLSLDWFSGLTAGVYRLTYTVRYDGGEVLAEERPFSACFSLTEENG